MNLNRDKPQGLEPRNARVARLIGHLDECLEFGEELMLRKARDGALHPLEEEFLAKIQRLAECVAGAGPTQTEPLGESDGGGISLRSAVKHSASAERLVPKAVVIRSIEMAMASTNLKLIRNKVRDREGMPDWDWGEDGCHVFASAMAKAFGGEVAGVFQQNAHLDSLSGSIPCWDNMHSVLKLDDDLFDCRGLLAPERAMDVHRMPGAEWADMPLFIATMGELEERCKRDGDDFFWPEDEFLQDDESRVLAETLNECARLAGGLHNLQAEFEARGVDSWVMFQGDRIILSKLVVEEKKKGLGTAFMEGLVTLADQEHRVISLTADDGFGATSVDRLKRFYKRFGFIENRGGRRDFSISENMIRRPVERG